MDYSYYFAAASRAIVATGPKGKEPGLKVLVSLMRAFAKLDRRRSEPEYVSELPARVSGICFVSPQEAEARVESQLNADSEVHDKAQRKIGKPPHDLPGSIDSPGPADV
jgi:hypothetical protein